ncbi:MAG: SRPBCC family protein [Planctomycetaceae bacterium]
MIASIGSLLKGMLYGAGLMYFLDPDRGRRRRAGAIDRAAHLVHETERLWDKGYRDLKNRGMGVAAETRRAVSLEPIDDLQLVARVRAALGHHVSDAKQIDVSANKGTVTLRGTVRPGEPELLIPAVEHVAGVRAVESSLTTAGEPVPPRHANGTLKPAGRMLLTAGGGLLVLNGVVRRGFVPSFLGVAGAGMLVRSLTDRPGPWLGTGGEGGFGARATIRIHAPVEKVFDYISDIEQSGKMLPDSIHIEPLGGGRLRWTLDGPGGLGRITGEGCVVESVENERIVWASSDDSPIRYLKEARFVPDGDTTCVEVRVRYEPPGGIVAHAAASLIGLDPKSQLHRSLNRIKHHLEAGTVPRGAADDTLREHRG